MANMSYCRFRNTVRDLQDCEHAMHTGEAFEDDVSPEESKARDRLIKLCAEITEDYN